MSVPAFALPPGTQLHCAVVEVRDRTGRGAPSHLGAWEVRLAIPDGAEAELDVLDWATFVLRNARRLDDSVDFTYLARPFEPGEEPFLRGTFDKVLAPARPGRAAPEPEPVS